MSARMHITSNIPKIPQPNVAEHSVRVPVSSIRTLYWPDESRAT